jgi:preprotein translocase subunit SecA
MRVFGGERIASVMERLGVDDETPIENRVISKSLEAAQKKVEGYNFDARKNVVQYDDVMNRHRKATYIMRREILHQADIKKRINVFIEEEARQLANSPQLLTDTFEDLVTDIFPFESDTLDTLFDTEATKFGKALETAAKEYFQNREVAFTPEILRKVERDIYLQVLDNLWMQHLENMDHMREGIHWISVGQRDPLVEYRRQAQILFDAMQQELRRETLRAVFRAEPVAAEDLDEPIETELTKAARHSVDNAAQITEGEEFHEVDFVPKKEGQQQKKTVSANRKKARKAERQRRAKGKRKK